MSSRGRDDLREQERAMLDSFEYFEGMEARRAGRQPTQCPYLQGTPGEKYWRGGWVAADRQEGLCGACGKGYRRPFKTAYDNEGWGEVLVYRCPECGAEELVRREKTEDGTEE